MTNINLEQEDAINTVPSALCELAQQTGSAVVADTSGNKVDAVWTGAQALRIYSVLPNPLGSDSLYESIVLLNSGGTDISLSDYAIAIKNKTISLSGIAAASGFRELVGGRGLRNDGMCIGLKYHSVDVDTFCYGAVKEGQIVLRSGYDQKYQVTDATMLATKKQTSSARVSSVSKQMSCTEKIKIVKASEKRKYQKLQQTRQKEKRSYQQQLSKWKTREMLARNKQYLYKNINNLIASDIQKQWPDIWSQGRLSDYLNYAHTLAKHIDQGYIYTNKKRTPTGWRYEYTNNIHKHIQKQKQVDLLDVVVPYFGDYIDQLYRYQINAKTITAVNGL